MYGNYLNICNDGDTGFPVVVRLDDLDSSVEYVNGVMQQRQTWNNEITSWKCGKNVGVKLCYGSDDGDSGSEYECSGSIENSETGTPHSGNPMVGSNDYISKIIVGLPESSYFDESEILPETMLAQMPGLSLAQVRIQAQSMSQVKATFYNQMSC